MFRSKLFNTLFYTNVIYIIKKGNCKTQMTGSGKQMGFRPISGTHQEGNPLPSRYPNMFIWCWSVTILKFVYFLVVNNNKYLSYIVDNIIFGISVLLFSVYSDYPSRTVESKSLRLFWNFSKFCLPYEFKTASV